MKTRISVIICLLLTLCMVCAFADSAKKMSAKEFLDSYEKFVVEVEKAAEKGNYAGYADFLKSYNKFVEDYSKLDTSKWTVNDITRYSQLTNCYTAAATKLSGSMSSTPATTDDYSALMGAYADLYGSYGF